MSIDLLKILAESNKDIDNQKLMDYLAGQLNEKELHDVEKSMASSEFMNDAVEGLMAVKNNAQIPNMVEQLNRDLQKKLVQKKKLKDKRKLKEYPWIYFSIVLILVLAIISWFVLTRIK